MEVGAILPHVTSRLDGGNNLKMLDESSTDLSKPRQWGWVNDLFKCLVHSPVLLDSLQRN